MKFQDQVCSLELAQKLKELGAKQDSLFYYVPSDVLGYTIQLYAEARQSSAEKSLVFSAYTVAELGTMLPQTITAETITKAYPPPTQEDRDDEEFEYILDEYRDQMSSLFKDIEYQELDDFDDGMKYDIKLDYQTGTTIRYWQETDDWECNWSVFEVSGDTEADCRATMLCYLIENKLVTI